MPTSLKKLCLRTACSSSRQLYSDMYSTDMHTLTLEQWSAAFARKTAYLPEEQVLIFFPFPKFLLHLLDSKDCVSSSLHSSDLYFHSHPSFKQRSITDQSFKFTLYQSVLLESTSCRNLSVPPSASWQYLRIYSPGGGAVLACWVFNTSATFWPLDRRQTKASTHYTSSVHPAFQFYREPFDS